MKLRSISCYASMAALGALLPLATATSRAASNPSTLNADNAALQQATPERVDWDEAQRHKLRHAYWLLEGGNREYKGHRVKAMEEIKIAAKMRGLDLHGKGYGGKRQLWSDEHLREARKLLTEIVDTHHQHEHEHIWKALKEIDKALEVSAR